MELMPEIAGPILASGILVASFGYAYAKTRKPDEKIVIGNSKPLDDNAKKRNDL